MIYTIGDSHCDFSFKDIPGVLVHRIGPITLKRIGHLEDDLLVSTIQELKLQLNDTIILCFGEIDVRCFVKPNLLRKNNDLQGLLQNWVTKYLIKASTVSTNGAKVAIMSVPPPAYLINIYQNETFPVSGTDEERAYYTSELNKILNIECVKYNLLYVDVYSKYKDEQGMLIKDKSDGAVHILDNSYVKDILIEIGLL